MQSSLTTGLGGEERIASSMIVVVGSRCPVKTRGARNEIHKAGRSRTFIVFIDRKSVV